MATARAILFPVAVPLADLQEAVEAHIRAHADVRIERAYNRRMQREEYVADVAPGLAVFWVDSDEHAEEYGDADPEPVHFLEPGREVDDGEHPWAVRYWCESVGFEAGYYVVVVRWEQVAW